MRIAIFILITMAILIYLLYINIKTIKNKQKTMNIIQEEIKILEKAKAVKGKDLLSKPVKTEKAVVSSSPKKKSRFELMDI